MFCGQPVRHRTDGAGYTMMAPERPTTYGPSGTANASSPERWKAALIAVCIWAIAAALGWLAIGIAVALWITS
jgi:hypothetical protein